MANSKPTPTAKAYRPRLALGAPQRLNGALTAKQSSKKAEKEYPWDSHQDDIIVNTTELVQPGRKLGIEHYRHQLTLRKTYEHITTDFAADQRKNIPKDAIPIPTSFSLPHFSYDNDDKNDDDDDGTEAGARTRTRWEQDSTNTISSTTLPKPISTRLTYSSPIYRATTTNPAVFLAIIRIAERNLPFINFDSANTHLPNLLSDASLPSVPTTHDNPGHQKMVFSEDIPREERKGDEVMTVLFLPAFYSDGRHAVGYYGLRGDRDESKERLESGDVVQVLFTPCETRDLERWGLVEWVEGFGGGGRVVKTEEEGRGGEKEGGAKKDKGGDEGLDVEYMECVGARDGRWLECDVVEDYDEWVEGFRVVRRIWGKMIRDVVSGVEGVEV